MKKPTTTGTRATQLPVGTAAIAALLLMLAVACRPTEGPTPYPTVCVVIEGPVGTFNDECFVDKPAPTPAYSKIDDSRLLHEMAEAAEESSGNSTRSTDPSEYVYIQIVIETHPGQTKAVETWLADRDGVNIGSLENWIEARLPFQHIPDLNDHAGVKRIEALRSTAPN